MGRERGGMVGAMEVLSLDEEMGRCGSLVAACSSGLDLGGGRAGVARLVEATTVGAVVVLGELGPATEQRDPSLFGHSTHDRL